MAATVVDIATSDSPFLKITQDSIMILEGITAAEKAQAVPYLKIWQIDPTTGKPAFPNSSDPNSPAYPFSTVFVEPPRFGSQIQNVQDGPEFRERPPVSLQRIVVKTDIPKGRIQYSRISLSFVVHRPDVIFSDKVPDRDAWSQILAPGAVFAMRYGWTASSGVKNNLLNGSDFKDGIVTVPSFRDIRFQVTNFNFSITPDLQFEFHVEAMESGHLHVRRTLVSASTDDDVKKVLKKTADKFASPTTVSYDPYSDANRKLNFEIQNKVKAFLKKAQKNKKGAASMVGFKSIVESLFKDSIEASYRSGGYGGNVQIIIGKFNGRAGFTSDTFGGVDQSDQLISSFLFPYKAVEDLCSHILKDGQDMTVYNFMNQFLRMFNTPASWSSKQKDNKIPEITIKEVLSKAGDVDFYIFDAKRELIVFDKNEEENTLKNSKKTRDDVKKALKNLNIPMVSLLKGNSYIQDAKFGVQLDDKMKSIFVRRYFNDSKANFDITKHPDLADKLETGVDPREIMYSSAITGDLTMIGNFAFDTFGMVWLDFNVKRFDGPFFIMSREDVIERGNFSTKVHLYSAGVDILGTQGRAPNKNVTTKPK